MEAVASIVGISHFGGELAHQLYKLGVNIATARKQSNKISERMTDYTTILDILEATLEGDTHIFSSKAEESIMKHCDRSWDLFEEIERLLPPRKEGRGRDDLTWKDKLKWNFRKSRIELLLGDLEYVKSDVVLILVTQLLGQKIKSYKKSKKRSNKKEQEKEAESVQRQTVKAKNAILQHMNAAENLSRLQEDADKDDKSERPPTGMELASRASNAMTLISRQNEIISNFQQAMVRVNDPGQRQAYMIQHSPDILQDLLTQWTKVDVDEGGDFKPSLIRLTGQTGTSTAEISTSDAPRPDLDDSDSSSEATYFSMKDYMYEGHRKEPPNFSRRTVPTLARSQTMPAVSPSSRKDKTTPRASKLKHTETRDGGGSDRSGRRPPPVRTSQTFKTPYPTKHNIVSPSDSEDDRRPTATKTKQSSTKYQIIDPSESEDDGRCVLIDPDEPSGFRTLILDPNEPSGLREMTAREKKEERYISRPPKDYRFDNSSSNPRSRQPRGRHDP